MLVHTQTADGATRLAERLQAQQTCEGDGALHLAAHAGSTGCMRLLLAAGAPHTAGRNAHGLSAAELAVHKACLDTGAAATEEDSDSYVAGLRLLAAAGSPLGATSMRRVAAAAAGVDEWRLLRLAAVMRRAEPGNASGRRGEGGEGGEDSEDSEGGAGGGESGEGEGGGGEGGGGKRGGGEDSSGVGAAAGERTKKADASAVAVTRGRRELAALLRAPPPPRGPLLYLRCPIEGGSPEAIVVTEGSHAAPDPATVSSGLWAALYARYRTLIRHSLMSVPPPPLGGRCGGGGDIGGSGGSGVGGQGPLRGYAPSAAVQGPSSTGGKEGEEGGSLWRQQQRAASRGGAGGDEAAGEGTVRSPEEADATAGIAEAAAEAVGVLAGGAPPPRARRLFRRVATAAALAEGAPPPPALLARAWHSHARPAPPPLGVLAARAAEQAEAGALVPPPPLPCGAARYRLVRRWEAEGIEAHLAARPACPAPSAPSEPSAPPAPSAPLVGLQSLQPLLCMPSAGGGAAN